MRTLSRLDRVLSRMERIDFTRLAAAPILSRPKRRPCRKCGAWEFLQRTPAGPLCGQCASTAADRPVASGKDQAQ
jgi:hypothetical protein